MGEHDNTITKEQVEELINSALDQLYENDSYLVNNEPFLRKKNGNHHVGERSIVFRLAHYMQNIMDNTPAFKNYVLDCEYNRNGVRWPPVYCQFLLVQFKVPFLPFLYLYLSVQNSKLFFLKSVFL